MELGELVTDSEFNHKEFWNKRNIKVIAALNNEVHKRRVSFLPVIRDFIVGKSDKALLVGCGVGEYIPLVCEFAKELVACDVSERAVKCAAERYAWLNSMFPSPAVSFDVMETIAALGYEDESFDCIVTVSQFMHIRSPEAEMLRDSMRRVLKPDGYYFAIEPTWVKERVEALSTKEVRPHMSYRTSEDFLKMVGVAFKVLRFRSCLYVLGAKDESDSVA